MNDKKTQLQQSREVLIKNAQEVEEIAAGGMQLLSNSGSMESEIRLAIAMVDMRRLLTEELMRPIMELMNTNIGFKCDRAYDVETVKEVVIEAKLRGFHVVGNEFNIISGRFYGAKAGFRRKLTDGKSFPGLSGFRDTYKIPKMIEAESAVVECKAEWVLNGKKDSYESEFSIKVNKSMGADAIIGKAERKLCKRVHDLLSGVQTPDADADDFATAVNVTPPTAGKTSEVKLPKKREAKPPEIVVDKPAEQAPAESKAPSEPMNTEPQLAPDSPASDIPLTGTTTAASTATTSYSELIGDWLAHHKSSFDDLREVCEMRASMRARASLWTSVDDVSNEDAKTILENLEFSGDSIKWKQRK